MILHGYWRSGATYRVRIALNYKKIAYTTSPVHLLRDGGEHLKESYVSKNPQALVPTLEFPDGFCLSQSLAILLMLEDLYPSPSLLPSDLQQKAIVLSIVQWLVSETQPLHNMRTMNYLNSFEAITEKDADQWRCHWIKRGLDVLEAMVSRAGGLYCVGDTITLADVCLVPQWYSAKRYHLDLSEYPRLAYIEKRCQSSNAFYQALPELQPDAM